MEGAARDKVETTSLTVKYNSLKAKFTNVKAAWRSKAGELEELRVRSRGLEEALRGVLRCSVCLEVPTSSPIYTCTNNHTTCTSCRWVASPVTCDFLLPSHHLSFFT